MKISPLATFLLATATGVAADPTHQISGSYNNLIFFDNEQISSPTFVQDFTDASTFAIAGGIAQAREDGSTDTFSWDAIYATAGEVFSNIGFVLESGPTIMSPEDGFCASGLTISEVVGSVYAKKGGPDSQELGELLQANNADVLDPEAVEVIDSWLGRGQCLDANTCFDTDDYIVSVTYVGESSSGDQFVENYRVFFSPVPPEELQVAQPTSTEATDFRITRVDMVRWLFNEEVYATVRDEIASKLAESTSASTAKVGPAFVLDRDEVPVEPFMPVPIVDGQCPNATMPEDDNATMDPSGIVEKLGACVDATAGDIDMECIQGVLATLDPATIGKLAQCAGEQLGDDMQTCVKEQLGMKPEDGNATVPEDTTSPGTVATTSGFMGFSVVALAVGLFY